MNISINIIIRYLISILFFVSAITKLYPFEMMQGIEKGFVQGQLVPMGFTEILASYFARFIIAVEFFIALAFLQRNYLKKIIIPFSILLVSVFTFHLLYKVALGDSSNCGCFGELIKMTPLEAVIKNILTLVALIFLYIKSSEKNINFNRLLIQFLICLLFMYSIFPVNKNVKNKRVSSFSEYVNTEIDINSGKKILCFFDAGCEHCMEAAKSLKILSDSILDFPELHIIFSDSEMEKIPEFFNYVGKDFSYQVVPFYNDDDDINSYLEIVGLEYDNPVIIYLNNGNQIRFYDGSGVNQFSPNDLKKILE